MGLLLLPASAGAEDVSVDARLDALEARWTRMEAELAALRALVEQSGTSATPALPKAVDTLSSTVDGLGADLATVREQIATQEQALAGISAARQREIAIKQLREHQLRPA
jgi:predicted  nucleic acid-binding Zn-ribbon protein